jgi:hypothetical protein
LGPFSLPTQQLGIFPGEVLVLVAAGLILLHPLETPTCECS